MQEVRNSDLSPDLSRPKTAILPGNEDWMFVNEEPGHTKEQPYKKFVIAACLGSSALLGALLVPFVAPGWRKIALPFLPATTRQVDLISSFLSRIIRPGFSPQSGSSGLPDQGTAGGSPGLLGSPAFPDAFTKVPPRRLIDLGSGDGRLVIAAAQQGMQATGVELNLWLVLWSRFQSLKNGSVIWKRTKFYTKDLFKTDLKNYEVIVLFGVDGMMDLIKQKLLAEMQEDAIFVACRFPLPECPSLLILGTGVDTVWIYRKQDIAISHNLPLEKDASILKPTEEMNAQSEDIINHDFQKPR